VVPIDLLHSSDSPSALPPSASFLLPCRFHPFTREKPFSFGDLSLFFSLVAAYPRPFAVAFSAGLRLWVFCPKLSGGPSFTSEWIPRAFFLVPTKVVD